MTARALHERKALVEDEPGVRVDLGILASAAAARNMPAAQEQVGVAAMAGLLTRC
jgi:hypothetical protein